MPMAAIDAARSRSAAAAFIHELTKMAEAFESGRDPANPRAPREGRTRVAGPDGRRNDPGARRKTIGAFRPDSESRQDVQRCCPRQPRARFNLSTASFEEGEEH